MHEMKSKKLICSLHCGFSFDGSHLRDDSGGKVPIANNRRWLPARARAREIMRDVLQTVTLLANAPLPHSPGAITAIITGPWIFPARGLHTRDGAGRGRADEGHAITPS